MNMIEKCRNVVLLAEGGQSLQSACEASGVEMAYFIRWSVQGLRDSQIEAVSEIAGLAETYLQMVLSADKRGSGDGGRF